MSMVFGSLSTLAVIIPDEFIEDKAVTHTAFRVYMMLKYQAASSHDIITIDYDRLKDTCHISYSTIAKAIRELVTLGWIKRERQFGKPTTYILLSTKENNG